MKKLTLHSLNIAILTLLSANTFAESEQNNNTSTQPHKLDTIVVTASGFEQKITDAPASISVVTEEDLRQKPYLTLIDAVRDLEGVDVGETRDKTGQSTISFRGMGSDYTLVLVDGKRQTNHGDIYPNSFGGNQFAHVPPLDAIERIEVIRGPASTLYGADALGGVINIITKKITDTWTGSITTSRSIQSNDDFGDDITYDFSLRGPVIANKLGVSLRGSIYERLASTPEYDSIVDPNGETHERSLGFGGGGKTVDSTSKAAGISLIFTPTDNQSITFDYDTSIVTYDNTPTYNVETGSISYPLGTLDNIESVWRASRNIVQPRVGYTEEQEFTRDSWALTHQGDWNFGKSFVSLAYVSTENNGRSLPFTVAERKELQTIWDAVQAGTLTEAEGKAQAEQKFLPRKKRTLESNQYTLDAKLDIPINNLLGNHIFVVGTQIINGELNDGVFGMEEDQPDQTQDQKMYSFFVEDSWNIIDPFTLTLGVRYDKHDLFDGNFSPRVYGVYTLNDQWTVKGGVSTGYKAPKTTDLYDGITGFGGQGVSPWAGNPDLKPEKSVNSEIAVYWNHPDRHSFNITLFKNDFKDKIVNYEVRQTCEQTGGIRPCVNLGNYGDLGYTTYAQKVNVSEAEILGVEIAGRYQILDNLGFRANYTYTDSEQKGTPGGDSDGQPLTQSAKHMINATLDWEISDKLNTFLSFESRSKRFRGVVGNQHVYYKDYEVFNLGANYKINDTFTVTGRINNLLDEDFTSYQTIFTQNDAGGYDATFTDDYNNKDKARSFWLSLNARF
ncbi:TonB-dependent receptor [Acinetobacter puyangensis]|uniref:Outer membrane receptor for ferrienterochelin and colicins n=1 Tax=Acinetobacter puyangensis TaxID=1096779 RepID=A0A240ECQ8_9GAMM|nr:TonB-dependent receptor [Acinetobacter puyangensis]SNX46484.1 outer membrane receptor for ferrienterochelin and colicins [Acinetobacter puyangensis]